MTLGVRRLKRPPAKNAVHPIFRPRSDCWTGPSAPFLTHSSAQESHGDLPPNTRPVGFRRYRSVDTKRSDCSLSDFSSRGVTQDGPLASIWFQFNWTLASGAPADFECVDMLELDEEGLITALHIFYDTAPTRPAFERETGTSWRPVTP